MQPPEGIPIPEGQVCRLRKSLYGLKQVFRQWFAKLSTALLSLGYSQSKNDYSLYSESTSGLTNTEVMVIETEVIKDLGYLYYFLGFEVMVTDTELSMTQCKFVQELLSDSGLTFPIRKSKAYVTPLPLKLKLTPNDGQLLANA
ncbi:hypothetical protein LIER_32725 [Lithospermum erythrorhizon]|uniref:Reverse transcriptase Ty1/copia-type domain-containing protein n=1 Tax=Lithospermum erythrorhizon TaxID=34254 RepID=A0AAV3RVZ9_LITER